MLQGIKNFVKGAFTEPNNQTVCIVRVFGVGAVLQGQAMCAYNVFINHAAFDLQAYGFGTAAGITALGVALGMKKDSP